MNLPIYKVSFYWYIIFMISLYIIMHHAIHANDSVLYILNHFANFIVNSLAFAYACFLLLFQWSAASLFNGSYGFGSDNKLWIDNNTDLICNAGDQFFFKMSKHILPKLSNVN